MKETGHRAARRRVIVGLSCLVLAVTLAGCTKEEESPAAPAPASGSPEPAAAHGDVATLRIGSSEIEAELAYRAATRERGLMFRHELPQNHGMLFVFAQDQPRSFYMMNMILPLTIAYIDKDGKIIDLIDMDPDPEGGYGTEAYSTGPARYALEMVQGWFGGHNVKVGDKLEIPAWVLSLPVDPEKPASPEMPY